MRKYLTCLLFIIISLVHNATAQKSNARGKSPLTIWAIDDGEKIRRDDNANPLANDPNNAVWKNSTIKIFGGKNELIAFQLIIQAGAAGAKNVNVVISNLVNGAATIPGSAKGPSDPFDYRNRNVELFTAHYLNITKRSPPLWFYAPAAAPSVYDSGWIPDALIPFSAPPAKGGAPFSIRPNNNQAVWVDILVPSHAKAGTYTGKATVTLSGKPAASIPVSLRVYDFTLPDSTHIKTMFGLSSETIAARHGVKNGSREYYDIEARYYQMAHRHRFDLVKNVSNLTDMDNHYKKYFTGELYTPGHGYAGPGTQVGNETFSIGYAGHFPAEYGGSRSNMNETSWNAGSNAWEEWFIKNAAKVQRHKYLFPDEPEFKGAPGKLGTGSMDTIKMQGTWTHNNPGVGKNIPALVTNKIKGDLMGYIDFWSISSEEATTKTTVDTFTLEKSKGRKIGVYNGYRPGMGAVISDADAVEFRVMPWIVWKYNIDQYFYWETTFWSKNNVFENPLTFEDRINGDGTFFYPGQDKLFPAEDRNLQGPVSSIRQKNWRRGAQDYEYLWLAKKAGLEVELNKIVNACVPAALWDAKSLQDASWPARGYKFEEYRKQVAELLSGAGNR